MSSAEVDPFESMVAELVPFGKYRGQPLQVMLRDDEYCSWVLDQPGLVSRYADFMDRVRSHGKMHEGSPDHNAMQASFLDDDKCLALAASVNREILDCAFLKEPQVESRRFEADGCWDIRFTVRYPIVGKLYIKGSCGRYGYEHEYSQYSCYHGHPSRPAITYDSYTYSVELKPLLGDDYPRVLRQVLGYPHRRSTSDRTLVVVREAKFSSVTWDQVVQVFAASRILLVREP